MSAFAPEIRMVPLTDIQTDEAAQTRFQTRPGVVRDYAAAMKAQLKDGDLRFPPIVLFADGKLEACPTASYYLADGYHRVLAARKSGLTEIKAEIHQGTQRDAILYGISANSAHGLRRTNADKRKAVQLLLADAEWSQWSDREIGKRCGVSNRFVGCMRSASVNGSQIERKVKRGGAVYAMSVKPAKKPSTSTALANPIAGSPLPASRRNVFESLDLCHEAHAALAHAAKLIDQLARTPAGELYAKQLIWKTSPEPGTFICPDLRACAARLTAAEPYCAYCPRCFPGYPDDPYRGCSICAGRGWTTKTSFDACTLKERETLLQLMRPKSGAEN